MNNNSDIPKHIAIIMDGNGRWAREKRLPKIMGHRKGAEAIRGVLKACGEWGVKYLTLYAFSTENWNRPKYEVEGLMLLLENQLGNETKNLLKNNVRLNAIGRVWELPERVQLKLKQSMELTDKNSGVVLTLALNYGGRAEIIDAVKKIVQKNEDGALCKEDIDISHFQDYLYTKDIPDPDLLIRTSGEQRVSNFLLWQIAYTEFYVTNKPWPDFSKADLKKAIAEFGKRQRRYGGR